MNKAQKRACFSFAISLATIVIAAAVIVFVRINQIDIYGPIRFRVLGVVCTIPLISMVILGARFPTKRFDEGDKLIERKALTFGTIGAFVFLAGAGWFLCVISRMGSIRASLIITLVYLACFVCILVSSAGALIQYGWGARETNHE